jgi:hypothetical protein
MPGDPKADLIYAICRDGFLQSWLWFGDNEPFSPRV